MRVLWTHNFDPRIPNKGIFVNSAAEGIRARGIDLHVEYLGNLRSVAALMRARAHVKRLARGFDLIHAQFGSACSLATAAAQGIPRILTIRGSDWNAHRASKGFLYAHTRIASGFTRFAIDSYDCVVAVSHRIATELKDFAPQTCVTVLPSPINLSRFVPRDRRQAKALLGFPECTERWILFNSLNLLNPIKRFSLAKESFEIARKRHGNLSLRLAADLPHDTMPLFVAACDLILCTSDNEGWPNSVKEALACNVPFVATDVSDLRDIALSEPSCRVCPPDPGVIADNICDVLGQPAPEGLRKHVLNMSVEATSDRLISTYQSVLSQYRTAGSGVSANA